MKVAVVGVTGLVGQMMITILEERNFPVTELIPVASEGSIGKQAHFRNKAYQVISIDEGISRSPDLALFSAGADISLQYAPRFAERGTTVIDNSSAWRMDEGKKLIIPEINGHLLSEKDKIISNPNCSTIQMLMVLAPLHQLYHMRRIVISTYQSVSGTGISAINQLENERAGIKGEMSYPYPIDKNCLPHCDHFIDNGYTLEEMKLVNETHKILEDPGIRITATAVRVPVIGGHAESVNVEFNRDYALQKIREVLSRTSGVTVVDDPQHNQYPMPIHSEGKDTVFVGRIRRDFSTNNALNLWIVADNLRKGAATNAVQIGEFLLHHNLI
jgi:aspartate-semialdehyde dehydrogenase